MGNWMGWNMSRGENKGAGRAEFEYVIVSTAVIGPAADDGAKFAGAITVHDRTGGSPDQTIDIKSASLTELRERSMQEGARSNIAAGKAYRDKQWGRRGGQQSGGPHRAGSGTEFSDPTGMGGE